MLSDEEKKAIDYLQLCYDLSTITNESLSKLGVVLNLIEKQSKEIEELNLKNEKLYEDNLTLAQEIKEFIEGTNDVKYYSTSFIKNHYISKDKTKAKIEELDKMKSNGKYTVLFNSDNVMEVVKAVLQSLLEKE